MSAAIGAIALAIFSQNSAASPSKPCGAAAPANSFFKPLYIVFSSLDFKAGPIIGMIIISGLLVSRSVIPSDDIYKGVDCKKHTIYCQVVDNYRAAGKKNINTRYAMRLSNIIHRYTRRYSISSDLFTAILAQESMYRADSKNCQRGLADIDGELVERKICSDFGISQIHYKTIERYNLDPERLLTDLEYSIEAGVVVLKDVKRRYGKKDPNWWTRYNASSPSKRSTYKDLVSRFLRSDSIFAR